MDGVHVIRLSGGVEAIVDSKYADIVESIHWAAQRLYGLPRYVIGSKDGRKVFLHRLITGAQKGQSVDHINGDGLDNREVNLRIATTQQNLRNQRIPKHNSSGFKGVSRGANASRWRSTITVDGKQIHLGYFNSLEEAAQAYDSAASRLFGEFACLNFPRQQTAA